MITDVDFEVVVVVVEEEDMEDSPIIGVYHTSANVDGAPAS